MGRQAGREYLGLLYEPLPAAEVAALRSKAGYRLTIVVREGIPLGPLTSVLTLNTSLQLKKPITLPIFGHVSPEISLIGPRKYNQERNILYLGNGPQGPAPLPN